MYIFNFIDIQDLDIDNVICYTCLRGVLFVENSIIEYSSNLIPGYLENSIGICFQ